MAIDTYFFQPEKKVLRQSFYLTDIDGKVVYEAKMIKQTLIRAMVFIFTNHISNTSVEHKVGRTVTTERDGFMGNFFFTKSYFKYDGTNIWDYLHHRGVRIHACLARKKIAMSYEVSLEGKYIAIITMTSPNGNNSVVNGNSWLKIITSEENLDLAFLTAFAISRTDQMLYN